MKKRNIIMLIVTIFIASIILFNPSTSYAWDVDNTSVSNIVVREGRFQSFDFHFEVPTNLAETNSWLGLQSVKFDENAFTDRGTIYERNYAGPNAVMNDDDFRYDYGIQQFSKNSFPCFGRYSTVDATLSDLAIDSDANATYYVYLWTFYGGSFYPDKLLASVEFSNGTIKIVDSSESEMISDTFENLEAEVVDKIEINNVDFKIKVGKKPNFNGEIKDNSNRFDLVETFMSLNRSSTISSDDDYDIEDEDWLVEDFEYFHITEIAIKDNVNLKFDENTKVYINGVEQKRENIYVNYSFISISDEADVIIPEGYVAPAYLDEDFEEEQRNEIEKIVIEAIKAGKVTFDSEEAEEKVNEALENDTPINVYLYVSESYRRSIRSHYLDEEATDAIDDKIGSDYKFAAYYVLAIDVEVDGIYVGNVATISTPLSITVPYPNGMPDLSDGYERIWKFIRYHDGEVIELDGEETTDGISLDNDKYSIFALVYKDVKIEKPEEEVAIGEAGNQPATDEINDLEPKTDEAGNQPEKTDEVDEISNPETGDNIMIWMGMLIISILSIQSISKKFKVRKN